jgi:hypothetical protein
MCSLNWWKSALQIFWELKDGSLWSFVFKVVRQGVVTRHASWRREYGKEKRKEKARRNEIPAHNQPTCWPINKHMDSQAVLPLSLSPSLHDSFPFLSCWMPHLQGCNSSTPSLALCALRSATVPTNLIRGRPVLVWGTRATRESSGGSSLAYLASSHPVFSLFFLPHSLLLLSL